VRGDERVDQVQGFGLEHGRLDFFVGHQNGYGQERVILDVVVRVERQREQPRGHVALDHQLLVLSASVQRQVGKGTGTVSEGCDVSAAALVQQYVQATEFDDIATRHFTVFKQMLENS